MLLLYLILDCAIKTIVLLNIPVGPFSIILLNDVLKKSQKLQKFKLAKSSNYSVVIKNFGNDSANEGKAVS